MLKMRISTKTSILVFLLFSIILVNTYFIVSLSSRGAYRKVLLLPNDFHNSDAAYMSKHLN